MAHDRLRWFATPMTRPCLPLRSMGYIGPPLRLRVGGADAAGRSRGPLRLPHPDGQDDHLHARELQPPLDRERSFGMERAREQVLALKHELTGEDDRTPELTNQVGADAVELVDQVRPQRAAVLGVVSHALSQLRVLEQIVADLRLERLDVLHALELGRVDQPDRYEHE